jgi:1,4-dihydroxy-2-naphthoyl-CoA hydrolase
MQQQVTQVPARSARPGAAIEAIGVKDDKLTATRAVGHIQRGAAHRTPWGIVHSGVRATAVKSPASLGASAAVADRGVVAVGLTNTTTSCGRSPPGWSP